MTKNVLSQSVYIVNLPVCAALCGMTIHKRNAKESNRSRPVGTYEEDLDSQKRTLDQQWGQVDKHQWQVKLQHVIRHLEARLKGRKVGWLDRLYPDQWSGPSEVLEPQANKSQNKQWPTRKFSVLRRCVRFTYVTMNWRGRGWKRTVTCLDIPVDKLEWLESIGANKL